MDYADLPSSLPVSIDGGLRVITLNRPDKLNAIDAAMHQGLSEVWRMLADDRDARVVLLLGNGPTFSAGGDFDFFRETLASDALADESFRYGQRIIDDLVRLPIPLVTGIRGGAVGLAASLGVLSDIVVMSDDGFYRDPHVAIGLAAGDGGVAAWPRSVPLQIAKEYLLLGDRLPAEVAHRLGMINRVVPSDRVDAEARAIAERIAKLPRDATSFTKRALNLHLERDIRGVAEFGLAAEKLTHHSPEFRANAARLGAPKT